MRIARAFALSALVTLIAPTLVFGVTINPRIPGDYDEDYYGVPGTIANLYQFALAFAGLLAFGAIVYGAIRYAASAGNTAQQSDAKDRITQALIGLLLLFGAVLILTTLSPGLLSPGGGLELSLPSIGVPSSPPPPPFTGGASGSW